ncbi:MAG TPA: adenylate cyclase, partial [Thermoanaerobaculia bacterium]|nr:adenylate cyclase [Thermoanaerobaculia bacterium]
LTVKGIGNASGASRFEWEKEIPAAEVEQLLAICEPGVIDKVRWPAPAGAPPFELDDSHGENEGLVVPEVEPGAEDEAFTRPAWLGAEVTGDPRYFNSMLMKTPYTRWGRPAE